MIYHIFILNINTCNVCNTSEDLDNNLLKTIRSNPPIDIFKNKEHILCESAKNKFENVLLKKNELYLNEGKSIEKNDVNNNKLNTLDKNNTKNNTLKKEENKRKTTCNNLQNNDYKICKVLDKSKIISFYKIKGYQIFNTMKYKVEYFSDDECKKILVTSCLNVFNENKYGFISDYDISNLINRYLYRHRNSTSVLGIDIVNNVKQINYNTKKLSEIINQEYKNIFNEEKEFVLENGGIIYDGLVVPVYKDYNKLMKNKTNTLKRNSYNIKSNHTSNNLHTKRFSLFSNRNESEIKNSFNDKTHCTNSVNNDHKYVFIRIILYNNFNKQIGKTETVCHEI
ncbi:hypothetical protein EHP00_1333 [Ecytonucleospora hepatopenaei]|uniref:Uncharacterized protein n=1 Tax=Ecytonucleospora hepatopenaei TaxID=646526 RepID=A0A1W0E6W3_9MICR|nr:hypothetical protein EHP00_1333 [Ecytonucleospora hepatopenaei]